MQNSGTTNEGGLSTVQAIRKDVHVIYFVYFYEKPTHLRLIEICLN